MMRADVPRGRRIERLFVRSARKDPFHIAVQLFLAAFVIRSVHPTPSIDRKHRSSYTCERLKIPTASAVGQRKQVLPARVYVKSNARRYMSKGQVTIPKEIRNLLKAAEGDRVTLRGSAMSVDDGPRFAGSASNLLVWGMKVFKGQRQATGRLRPGGHDERPAARSLTPRGRRPSSPARSDRARVRPRRRIAR
jgi:hypothetical protein